MPILKIYMDRIMDNVIKIKEINKKLNNAEIMIVTKVVLSDKTLVSALAENGIKSIGDTRLSNLNRVKDVKMKKMLMSISMSDIIEELENVDIIYATELTVLDKISKYGYKKPFDVIVPIELGELREGVPVDEIFDFIKTASNLSGINIIGIAGNFGCLNGLVQNSGHFDTLIRIKKEVFEKYSIELKYISVGGTILLEDFMNNKIPSEINHFRFGEGMILGHNTSLKRNINEMNHTNFILEAEVIEVREKNTNIDGEFAYNAFGDKPHIRNRIINKGIRKRAVLNFGFLSSIIHSIKPINSKIEVIANSHDHTVIDITDYKEEVKVGDKIEFYVNYDIICFAMISDNFTKKYIK